MALILALPVMAIIAATVWFTMGRPILFRQRRPGLNAALFTCLKFRTMTEELGPDGLLLSEEFRVTELGTFLRRTSFDELPQLWNIVRGDLSLVGPRPLLEKYLPLYTPEEQRRHSVRPGLTGWAQIHGRTSVSFDDRLAMDSWYVDHVSLWLDIRIHAATVLVVLTQKGVGITPGTAAVALDAQRSAGNPHSDAY
jgi:sugar transferase EpsL